MGVCTRDTAYFRYLAYDASPQRGIELFATVERVVTVDACGNTVLVRERRLPLVTLGHGRASLSDKIQAHVYQTWLEYGSRLKHLRRANVVVRQCLSDMGTELGLVDAADVTPMCACTNEADGGGDWL